jgi:hypothetical protein
MQYVYGPASSSIPVPSKPIGICAAAHHNCVEIRSVHQIYAASFFVDILNGTYNGQNAMELVIRKITANRPSMMAAVPDIWFVKYNTATTRAKRTRIERSTVPMFFFITASLGKWMILSVR